MTNIVIAGYARSPFTQAGKGALARVRPDDIAAQVIRGLIERSGVDPAEIEDIILGCAFPEGEQGMNVARLIGLLADLPLSVGGMTVNRFCGSSMSAIHIAMGQSDMGAAQALHCAGRESVGGGRISRKQALIRFCGQHLLLLLTVGVSGLWMLWDRQKQTLHDKLARTRMLRGLRSWEKPVESRIYDD